MEKEIMKFSNANMILKREANDSLQFLRLPFVLFFLLLFCFAGCKKPENRKCYKSTGAKEEKVIYLTNFDSLFVSPKLKVHLILSTENKVVIRAGKNMMNFIHAEQRKSNWLIVSNSNKCSFLRKMNEEIEMDIYFTNMSYIDYQGSEDLTTEKLNIDSLIVKARVGNGTMYLDVNSTYLDVYANAGSSNYVITGNVMNTYLGIGSNCYCDATKLLVSNYMECINTSQGDAYINVNGCTLNALLTTRGNIYYSGIPVGVTKNEKDKGRLIQN
jgi:hypothetical protein